MVGERRRGWRVACGERAALGSGSTSTVSAARQDRRVMARRARTRQ
jgi:hypothetical protein